MNQLLRLLSNVTTETQYIYRMMRIANQTQLITYGNSNCNLNCQNKKGSLSPNAQC